MLAQFIGKYGKRVLVPGILLVSGILYFILQQNEASDESFILVEANPSLNPTLPESVDTNIQAEEIIQKVVVDIKGAVQFPGVYELTTEQRIVDAITLAGGYTENANPQLLNNAQKLQDEMVIYVPIVGEEVPEITSLVQQSTTTSTSQSNGKINLNTADESALTTLPGVGPARAQAIIAYRSEVGKFQSIEDIKNISGIGDKSFEKLKDLIDVK